MWVDEEDAAAAAQDALGAGKLLGHDGGRAPGEGHPGRPLLVNRLDTAGGYYLVPWDTSRGTEWLVRIDASTAELLGAVQLAVPLASPFLSAEAAVGRVRAEVPDVAPGTPRCVWRPCRESPTPFRPFYEVSLEEGHLFVDMEGVVHQRLTPFGRGG